MARSKAQTLLEQYRKKRDFVRTPEPQHAGRAARQSGLTFVVQKHAARQLHYDFRLEWDGVLKSWAVAKGPSLDPADKRLAVRTEDHPLAYAEFEGTIPKGAYGGGTVMLWDCGSWEPLDDPAAGLCKGKLQFRLYGERMTGGWALVRLRPKSKDQRENWLLIKERDEVAEQDKGWLEKFTTSVSSGRPMEAIGAEAAEQPKRGSNPARTSKPPAFAKPQLATLTDRVPEGRGWLHELNFDGSRCLLAAAGKVVRCYPRGGKDWSAKLAGLVEAAQELPAKSALIDGEVVAFNTAGRSDFSTLQKALSEGRSLIYFAFDLLSLDGRDLRKRPLLDRKDALRTLLETMPQKGPIQFSEHVQGGGEEVFRKVCAEGHEGIVSKKADAAYVGRRTSTWLKVKCTQRQEFVIGGWSPSDKAGRSLRCCSASTRTAACVTPAASVPALASPIMRRYTAS